MKMENFFHKKVAIFLANFDQMWRIQGYIWVAQKVAILGPKNGSFKKKIGGPGFLCVTSVTSSTSGNKFAIANIAKTLN